MQEKIIQRHVGNNREKAIIRKNTHLPSLVQKRGGQESFDRTLQLLSDQRTWRHAKNFLQHGTEESAPLTSEELSLLQQILEAYQPVERATSVSSEKSDSNVCNRRSAILKMATGLLAAIGVSGTGLVATTLNAVGQKTADIMSMSTLSPRQREARNNLVTIIKEYDVQHCADSYDSHAIGMKYAGNFPGSRYIAWQSTYPDCLPSDLLTPNEQEELLASIYFQTKDFMQLLKNKRWENMEYCRKTDDIYALLAKTNDMRNPDHCMPFACKLYSMLGSSDHKPYRAILQEDILSGVVAEGRDFCELIALICNNNEKWLEDDSDAFGDLKSALLLHYDLLETIRLYLKTELRNDSYQEAIYFAQTHIKGYRDSVTILSKAIKEGTQGNPNHLGMKNPNSIIYLNAAFESDPPSLPQLAAT